MSLYLLLKTGPTAGHCEGILNLPPLFTSGKQARPATSSHPFFGGYHCPPIHPPT